GRVRRSLGPDPPAGWAGRRARRGPRGAYAARHPDVRRIPRRSFLESCAAASTALGASPFLKGWSPMSKQRHVVVVGAGAFGGWTALHLLRRGVRVTLVDAWGPGNSRASSGGETRVIRGTYGPRGIYTHLTARALQLWKEHERRWHLKLYHPIGVLWLVESDEAYEKAALPLLKEAGRAVGEVAGGLVSCKLPDGSRIAAEPFLLACGPWLGQLFPDVIGDRVRATRQEVFFFGTPPGDVRFTEQALPVWADHGRGFIYGIPGNEW